MNMRKVVLWTVAIVLGFAAVYVFFFSTSSTSLPSGIDNKSDSKSLSGINQRENSAAAENSGGGDAPGSEKDIENTALRTVVKEEKVSEPPEAEASIFGVAAELFFYLILIVALIVGLLIFLKKIIPGGHRIFDSPAIEILGKANLTQKQAVYLAKMGRRVLVLGVGENSVNLLTEINDDEEINNLKVQTIQGGADSITNAFKSIFGRRHAEIAAADYANEKTVQGELERIHSMVDDWRDEYTPSQ